MIAAWLPSELLIEAFRYLTLTEQCLVLALVCRRYRSLCRSLPLCCSFDVQSAMASALLPAVCMGTVPLWQRRRRCQSLQRAVIDPCYWLRWLLLKCHTYRRDMLRDLRVTACDVPWPLLDRVVTLCGHRLTSLDLSHCLAATDAVLLECVAKCPNLRCLTLNFCAALTREGVAGALKATSCLHSLSLCGMSQVDDAVLLAALGAHHRSLTTLNLRATGVSVSAFAALTEPSRSLRVMGLSCCIRLTDAAMAHIARLYPSLEDISVDSCDAITDVGVRALTSGVVGLQRLSVARCRRVTDASVLPMLSRFSSTLRVVSLDDTKVSCDALAAVLRGEAMEEASLVGCKYVKAGLSRTSLRRGIHQAGRVHMFKKPTRVYLEI